MSVATATHSLHKNFAFLTAGNAIFTVSNPTGRRYTFRVNQGKCSCNKNPACGACGGDGKMRHFKTKQVLYFVQLLTGPDNTRSYQYMGTFQPQEVNVLKLTAKSKLPETSDPVKVFKWAANVLKYEKDIPEGYAIQHAGMCGKCRKTLTVPESIELGLGPVCAKSI